MVNKKVILGTLIMVASLIVLGGCSVAKADEVADLTGSIDEVMQVQAQSTGSDMLFRHLPPYLGQVLVSSPANSTSDKFMVAITNDTVIYYLQGGALQKVDFNSLASGQQVDIWFEDAVMESYPAQVSAMKIIITQDNQSIDMPPLDGGRPTVNMEVSIDDFSKQSSISREIEITFPGALVVTLGSNPTTGFSWNQDAFIVDGEVLTQIEHAYIPPEENSNLGVAGKEMWLFNSLKSGQTVLTFEYSRPWEGGEKAEWTLELVVTVS